MKLNILYLVFLYPLIIFSQEINQLDANGERHGIWTKNFENTDQPRYQGEFEHGKETGLFKYYKLVGGKSVLSATKEFDVKSGIAHVKFLSSKGKLISEGKMKGRLYVGPWVYYHNKTKGILSTETYNEQGKLTGEKLVYYENGQVAEKVYYHNGKINGLNTWYSENGKVLKELNYVDGILHGDVKIYDSLGILVTEGQYQKDKKHGIWKYYEEGKLKEEKDFTIVSKNPKKKN